MQAAAFHPDSHLAADSDSDYLAVVDANDFAISR